MSNEFPLFPELSEAGQEEAQNLINDFKKALTKAANEVISKLYCDIIPHIESDSWTNYRNDLMDGFRDYNNRLIQGEHDFKKIRQQLLEEFRADIIKDLDQDLVEENKRLKDHIEWMNNLRRSY